MINESDLSKPGIEELFPLLVAFPESDNVRKAILALEQEEVIAFYNNIPFNDPGKYLLARVWMGGLNPTEPQRIGSSDTDKYD